MLEALKTIEKNLIEIIDQCKLNPLALSHSDMKMSVEIKRRVTRRIARVTEAEQESK